MIVLCTDDPYFSAVVPYLFGDYGLSVFKINELADALLLPCSYFIIGLPTLDKDDGHLLSFVKNPTTPTFIMARSAITEEDISRVHEYGLMGILVDPLVRLRNDVEDVSVLLNTLNYHVDYEQAAKETVLIGCDTYFTVEKHLITHSGGKTELSDREVEMLKLFLRYEGKILTKDVIADELWNGQVSVGGIPKLISRLREKLGPAGSLINGRKQGGYIYEKFQDS